MLSPFIERFPNEVLKFIFRENCLNKKQRNETVSKATYYRFYFILMRYFFAKNC